MASSRARRLPWEVRLAVCASRPGSIYGTTERVIGEGALNLADFVGTSKAARNGAGVQRESNWRMQPASSAARPVTARPVTAGDVVASLPPRLSLASVAVAIAGSRVGGRR